MSEKRKVFISFRHNDGNKIKDDLIKYLYENGYIIDKSEDVDRSVQSEDTIQAYLFEKLRDSSITIVLLTRNAVNYRRDYFNKIDDWLYDELRYSLYDREDNRRNGIIALYTQQAAPLLVQQSYHKCSNCNRQSVTSILNFDNLVRLNMLNIKTKYKLNKCENLYDGNYDSYVSLIKLEDFYNNPKSYLDIAFEKRSKSDQYEIRVKMG